MFFCPVSFDVEIARRAYSREVMTGRARLQLDGNVGEHARVLREFANHGSDFIVSTNSF